MMLSRLRGAFWPAVDVEWAEAPTTKADADAEAGTRLAGTQMFAEKLLFVATLSVFFLSGAWLGAQAESVSLIMVAKYCLSVRM